MGATTSVGTDRKLEPLQSETKAQQNPPFAIDHPFFQDPSIICNQPADVAEVVPLSGYRLRVRFNDGTTGIVHMSERVHTPGGGVFDELIDVAKFENVRPVYGAVTWSTGADLAPDAMYTEFKRNGEWVLR